jgi:hypothetical protein
VVGETALFVVLVLAFATWTTAHAMLVLGLLRRPRRWRAGLALVLVPLAPWWGWREGMRCRSILWMVGLAAYAATLARAVR